MAYQLNEGQHRAVNHIDGPLLVLAGAGSGKTRVVTERLLHLLDEGIPAHKLLAVTFTNRAAGEMRARIQRSMACSRELLICTFHSLGARLLRESISFLGWPADYLIYDPNDCEKVVKSCLAELGVALGDGTIKPKSMLELISRCKNELKGPDQLEGDAKRSPSRQLLPSLYRLYGSKMAAAGAVDFDDLIYLPVRLFREHPDVLQKYQQRWHYILVDEYQDTNAAQYEMTRCLAGARCNLFVVGDPDQSIYSWRGAQLTNILHFESDFPGARLVRLEQNYRSTTTILEASNALIGHNEARYEKRLWSDRGLGEKIGLFVGAAEAEEAHFVAATIARLHKGGRPLDQMAIFYRTNGQSRSFEEELMRLKIPYRVIGSLAFYQRSEVKDLLAWMRMLISDGDFLSFERSLSVPRRGVGASTMEKIRLEAAATGQSLFGCCARLIEGSMPSAELKLNKRQRTGLIEYVGLISELRHKLSQGLSLGQLLIELIERSGYLAHLLDEDALRYDERKSNLDALIARATEWQQEREEAEEESSLSQFLQDLSLQTSVEESPDSSDEAVHLMTLHNGKGLEYPVVFLTGLEEGILPHMNAERNGEALEEERRLCYVGMTRAQDKLYLTRAQERTLWGTTRYQAKSSFLHEIPSSYLEKEKPLSHSYYRSAPSPSRGRSRYF